MLNINIKTVSDAAQRYNTVGDYYYKDESFEIAVSDFGNEKMELLVAVHELIESALCKYRNITIAEIEAFDLAYEKARPETDYNSEPGDDVRAPYYKEHVFATKLEKMLAVELGVDWDEYCALCEKLTKT